LLASGIIALIAADIVLARAESLISAAIGVIFWGLHMGVSQGLLAAMVADHAPQNLRGTAFGFFNLAAGMAMLAASGIAGFLWDKMGASVTFYSGACFATAALLLIVASRKN
jgi:MFS family permease